MDTIWNLEIKKKIEAKNGIKENWFPVSIGNKKLGLDTLIFNLGTGTNCPSKALGLCQVPEGKCYACKAEIYPAVMLHRTEQSWQWNNMDIMAITYQFMEIIEEFNIKFLRFNESGDFLTMEDIKRVDFIARHLILIGVVTYGYSARIDLFSDLKRSDLKMIVRLSTDKSFSDFPTFEYSKEWKRGTSLCIGNCRMCNACKVFNGPQRITVIAH